MKPVTITIPPEHIPIVATTLRTHANMIDDMISAHEKVLERADGFELKFINEQRLALIAERDMLKGLATLILVGGSGQ